MGEENEIKKTSVVNEKMKQPQINPRQLLVYVIIQIIGVIQGMLPVFLGESFNPWWFVASFIMDNVGYFCIMALRSVAIGETETDQKLIGVFGNFIQDALAIIKNPQTDNTQKISMFERMAVWTIRELDELYQEEFKRFTDHIRATYFNGDGVAKKEPEVPIPIKKEPVAPPTPKPEIKIVPCTEETQE
jgi:hypothetical protein